MAQRLNDKLECSECETTDLRIPKQVQDSSPVFCASCGNYVGRWREIEDSFIAQGGLDGIFELRDGHIIRRG